MKKSSKKEISDKDRLLVNPDLVFRSEGKEALVFDPGTGSIKVLNYVGKMVWKLLDGKNTASDIRKKLEKKFKDTKPPTIKKDLGLFLKSLEDLGYLGKKV
jgi:hypothetical protein